MAGNVRVVFLVGGATVHPIARQAGTVVEWLSDRLGDRLEVELLDGSAAFGALRRCDLLVLMGLHWSKMAEVDWAGGRSYRSPDSRAQEAFEAYVREGKPLLVHHSAIACYDDWPRYGDLTGVRWDWDRSSHGPIDRQSIRVLPTGHPVVAGLDDFNVIDEVYEDIWVAPHCRSSVHAQADLRGQRFPMVITDEGGRVDGAGRMVYVALGHDLRSFRSPSMRRLWMNTVAWLLEPR